MSNEESTTLKNILSVFYELVQNRIPSFLNALSLLGLYENFKKCFLKSLIS